MKCHVERSFFVVALVVISYGPAVTRGIDNLAVAEGKSVTINCTLSPKPGTPFIVWSWKPEGEQRREIFVCPETPKEVVDNHFSGRLSCPGDAFPGNASLVISSVTKQDSGVFYCCVLNSGSTSCHDVQVNIKEGNKHTENALYLLEVLMPIIFLFSIMVIVFSIGSAILKIKTCLTRRNFKKSIRNCLSSDAETPEEENMITDEPMDPNDSCVFFVEPSGEKNGFEKEI